MKATQFKILVILVVCFASPLFSENHPSSFQAPFATTTFAKRITATGSLVGTIQTTDKSYVSVSRIGSEAFFVRKIASSGARVWERILRLQVEDAASLAAVTQTTDGGYVLAGHSFDCIEGSVYDCLDGGRIELAGILIKLRPNGTIAWKREYSTNNNYEVFTSLVSTADGGVIVTGTTQYSLLLARYTSDGTILWSKSFPDLPIISIFSPQLVQTPNNSLILVANLWRLVNCCFEPAGAIVIKVNDSGAILWKKSLQMPNLSVQTIAATSDNGIVLAGSSNKKQLFVVRFKADGNIESKLRYSLQVPRVESIGDIIQTSDGGLTITGSVTDTKNSPNVFVVRIDSKGKASFQRTFRFFDSLGVSVFTLSDGYLLFGSAGSQDTIILKLDSQGLLRPGCDFVSSPPISPIPFGNLTINEAQINDAVGHSLGTNGLAGSSIAVRRQESDLCP
jgi:outer membrane protein assembly factor BamB